MPRRGGGERSRNSRRLQSRRRHSTRDCKTCRRARAGAERLCVHQLSHFPAARIRCAGAFVFYTRSVAPMWPTRQEFVTPHGRQLGLSSCWPSAAAAAGVRCNRAAARFCAVRAGQFVRAAQTTGKWMPEQWFGCFSLRGVARWDCRLASWWPWFAVAGQRTLLLRPQFLAPAYAWPQPLPRVWTALGRWAAVAGVIVRPSPSWSRGARAPAGSMLTRRCTALRCLPGTLGGAAAPSFLQRCPCAKGCSVW
jgi:hypothetical protein